MISSAGTVYEISDELSVGEELTAFLERHGKDFDRIVYVGDGSNDFCPILRLRKSVSLSFTTPIET